ncbi:MAG: SEC-C metal-binding domain-containing protein [Deltaproteobacteria bacterium]
MKTGRNDPCPCGSGKKYKQCCQLKRGLRSDFTDSMAKGLFYMIGPIIVIIITVMVFSALRGDDRDSGDVGARVWSADHGHWHVVSADGSQTEARSGQVWSEEHGHWHDAGPVASPVRDPFKARAGRELEEAQSDVSR